MGKIRITDGVGALRIWRGLLRLFTRRVLVGLIAVGHGALRLVVDLPTLHVSYGDSLIFGVTLALTGLAVLVTTRWRLRIVGRAAAVALAIVYGLLGAALVHVSPGSAWADLIFILAMIAEAGAYE
jgi:hypothetical protein